VYLIINNDFNFRKDKKKKFYFWGYFDMGILYN
jgi:hypothetical protein